MKITTSKSGESADFNACHMGTWDLLLSPIATSL